MSASPERLMVAWARANVELGGIVGGRVSTELPGNPTFPFLTVFHIGGGPDTSDAPVDQPLLQWDCYGAATAQGRVDADLLYRTLLDQLRDPDLVVVAGEGVVYGHQIIEYRRTSEPSTGWSRYTVSTLTTIRELVGGA